MAIARGCAFPNWHRRSRPPAHRRELRLDRLTEFFQNSASLNGSESGGGQFPARFFAPSGPAIAESTQRGKGKEEPMNPLIQLKKSTPLFLIPLVLACFALSPRAQAVTPAPDGGYPGFNTAEGFNALLSLTSGQLNTAFGFAALKSDTTGGFNTAIGGSALVINDTGALNTAVGVEALFSNNGTNNIALGFRAGSNLTAGNNNIDIGNAGVAAESATIRIGSFQTRTFIAGIRGRTTGFANAVPVLIDSNGQLGTASSSRRFKEGIKPIDQTSEAILALKPVTFHYKSDATNTPQFGLIAEEVAKVNPDLVVRDENGEIYTVRYDAVNAMLLNEFLKEHRKVQEQEARITQLNSTVEKQQATIAQQQKDSQSTAAEQQREIKALAASLKEQAAQIQKVNAQIELQSVPPSTVVNNP